jgi:transcriptional regulator with XRE-family HTH domain
MAKQRTITERERAALDRVKQCLDRQGLNWSDLARSVGKTASSASQWSGKRSFPRENVLFMMARHLGVDMGWLLTGDEPNERRLAQTEAELRLLDLVRQMSPDEQRALLAAAHGIKGSLTKK